MGGRVGMIPAGPDGAVLWLLFRQVTPARTHAARRLESLARQRRCFVLLVEDIAVNQVVTATQLRRDGHRVDIASSGPQALQMVATTPYDIVLMDLMMPGMSGYETTRRIRTLSPPSDQVTIYALTANTAQEDRALCLEAGMQGMLSKPVAPGVLARALQQGVTNRPAPPAPSNDLLDRTRLEDIRRDLPHAVFTTLSVQCLVDMRVRIGLLHTALDKGAPDGIQNEAHALAGMASSYGLAGFERLMRSVMTAARTGDTAAARAAASTMDDLFTRSDTALRAWLAPETR
jgi:CheY-like chemotaxis protein